MTKTSLRLAAIFLSAHIAIVASFAPLMDVLPLALGALSMSAMAFTLVLAARWRIVDRIMGGPDKSYAAHRWLGVLALGGAMGHWALASSAGAGVPPLLAESGEGAGNLVITGLLALMAAAVPYQIWKASHMLMGPIFLLAIYHTFLSASPLAVGEPPWMVMAVASAIGLVAWGQTLRRQAISMRRVTVAQIRRFDGGVDVTIRADRPLPDFRSGQFAALARDGARTGARLAGLLRGMAADAQGYLCGPEGLKTLVETAWRSAGRGGRLHAERFDFRGAYGLTDLIDVGKPVFHAARDWAAKSMDAPHAASGS